MKKQILNFTRATVLLAFTAFVPLARSALYDVVNVSTNANTFECSLVAVQMDVTINGINVHAMIYQDTSPGAVTLNPADGIPIPQIKVNVGDTIICHFTNNLPETLAPEGASIHWHGIELDADSDGTAVTQDAILPEHPSFQKGYGYRAPQKYVYQFKTFRPGSFWFHSHMMPGTPPSPACMGPLSLPIQMNRPWLRWEEYPTRRTRIHWR